MKSTVFLASAYLALVELSSTVSAQGISFPLSQRSAFHNDHPHMALPAAGRRKQAGAYHDEQVTFSPIESNTVSVSHSSVVYTITAGVGNPPQLQTLLVDTDKFQVLFRPLKLTFDARSSDLVVFSSTSNQCLQSEWGCGGGYNPLASSTYENADMSFVFGFANQTATARGSYVQDTVRLGEYVIPNQRIALVETALLDFDIEGVLGLGYQSSQQSELKYDAIASKLYAPYQQSTRPVFSLYLDSRHRKSEKTLKPSTKSRKSNTISKLLRRKAVPEASPAPEASLDIGFIDAAKHTGDLIAFVPCTSEHEFSVRLNDIRQHNTSSDYDDAPVSHSLLLTQGGAGFVDVLLDSGTIGILIVDKIADEMAETISSSAQYDISLPGYRVPCKDVPSTQDDYFEFEFNVKAGDSSFSRKTIKVAFTEISRELNSENATERTCVLDIVRESTYNIGNVLGTAFLSSVYAVFDVNEHRVGMAQAAFYSHH